MKGQAAAEYVLVATVLSGLGFLALKLWTKALGAFLDAVIRYRSGEPGMFP